MPWCFWCGSSAVHFDALVDVTGADWRNCHARGGEATAARGLGFFRRRLRFVRRSLDIPEYLHIHAI
jgi:hypothetical protein